MNYSISFFGCFNNGYSQYPDEELKDVFKNSSADIESRHLIIKRERELTYYLHYYPLYSLNTSRQYIGVAISFNNTYCSDIDGMFSAFDDVIAELINANILGVTDNGKIAAKAPDLTHNRYELERIINNRIPTILANHISDTAFRSNPPLNVAKSKSDSFTFHRTPRTEAFVSSIEKFQTIIIYNASKLDTSAHSISGKSSSVIKVVSKLRFRKYHIALLFPVCLGLAIFDIYGITELMTTNIIDHVVQYESEGKAILELHENSHPPYAIVMDSSKVFYDDLSHTKKILDVGKELKLAEPALFADSDKGLQVRRIESERSLYISNSNQCFITVVEPDKSFIISKTDKITSNHGRASECYALWLGEQNTVITYIKDAAIVRDCDNFGFETSLNRDFFSYSNIDFSKYLYVNELKKAKEKKLGKFSAKCILWWQDNQLVLDDNIIFPSLKMKVSARYFGSESHLSDFAYKVKLNIYDGLTDEMVSEIFETNKRLPKHKSDDGKYTFVIVEKNNKSKENITLYKINNETGSYYHVDDGMSITFEATMIKVVKYDTFLLFFDSSKTIYYDYSGTLYE